ncbi:MAG: molybdopterin molybdenumtransferase MoeA, partial [Chloroflexia bacterium]|nr:molybdopterin molybdenumtransferase MoeA [Chloroflexia bacterium]
MRKGMTESRYPMVSVEEAQQVIMGRVLPLDAEEVDALTADGRVLAQAIQAPLNIPDVPKAAMDGYALRTDDGLKLRRIVAELTAGTAAGVALEPGTTVRIMTGAPMP